MFRQADSGLRFDSLRGDFGGGVSAAVAALPLALAFGVASGAGPVAGVYGATFVGLLVARGARSRLVSSITDVAQGARIERSKLAGAKRGVQSTVQGRHHANGPESSESTRNRALSRALTGLGSGRRCPGRVSHGSPMKYIRSCVWCLPENGGTAWFQWFCTLCQMPGADKRSFFSIHMNKTHL